MSILELNKFNSNFSLESIPSYESLEYQFNSLDKSLERVDKLYKSLENVNECLYAMETLNLSKNKMVSLLNAHRAFDLINISKDELESFSKDRQYAVYQEGFFEFVGNVIAAIFNAIIAVLKWIIGLIGAIFGGSFGGSGGGGGSSSAKSKLSVQELCDKYKAIVSSGAEHGPLPQEWVLEAMSVIFKTFTNANKPSLSPFGGGPGAHVNLTRYNEKAMPKTASVLSVYLNNIFPSRYGLPSASLVTEYLFLTHTADNYIAIENALTANLNRGNIVDEFVAKLPNLTSHYNNESCWNQAFNNMDFDIFDIIEQQTGIPKNELRDADNSQLFAFLVKAVTDMVINKSAGQEIMYRPGGEVKNTRRRNGSLDKYHPDNLDGYVREAKEEYRKYVTDKKLPRNPGIFFEYTNGKWDFTTVDGNNIADIIDENSRAYMNKNVKGSTLGSSLPPNKVTKFLTDMSTIVPHFDTIKTEMEKYRDDFKVIEKDLEDQEHKIETDLNTMINKYSEAFLEIQNYLVTASKNASNKFKFARDQLNTRALFPQDKSAEDGKRFTTINVSKLTSKAILPFIKEYVQVIAIQLKLYVECVNRYKAFVKTIEDAEIPPVVGGVG